MAPVSTFSAKKSLPDLKQCFSDLQVSDNLQAIINRCRDRTQSAAVGVIA